MKLDREEIPEESERNPADEEAIMAEWSVMAEGSSDEETMSDDIAAEWEAMLGPATDDEDEDDIEIVNLFARTTRVLDQDEIDALLSFDNEDTPHRAEGVYSMVSSHNYEHFPLLMIIFKEFVKLARNYVAEIIKSEVEISLDNILSMRFGDYTCSIPLPAMFQSGYSDILDGEFYTTIDSSLIYSLVDVLLGGRRGTAAMRIEGRPYTDIENSLIADTFTNLIPFLNQAFKNVIDEDVGLEGKEITNNPRHLINTEASDAIIVAKLRIDMEDRGGRFEIAIPYYTLEPIIEKLRGMYYGRKSKYWKEQLDKIIPDIDIDLTIKSNEIQISAEQLLTLSVGDTIVINDNQLNLLIQDKIIGKVKDKNND